MTDQQKQELQAVITDLRFIVEVMSMHIATRDALGRNIQRLEAVVKK